MELLVTRVFDEKAGKETHFRQLFEDASVLPVIVIIARGGRS